MIQLILTMAAGAIGALTSVHTIEWWLRRGE